MFCDEEILFIEFRFGDDFECEFDDFKEEYLVMVIVDVFLFELVLVDI